MYKYLQAVLLRILSWNILMMPDMGFSYFFQPKQTAKPPGSFMLSSHRGWDKTTSFPFRCRSRLRFDLQRQQEKARSAGTRTPSMGLWHVTTHTFSALSAPGWLFWCPKTAASAEQFLVTGWGTPYTKIRKADFSCHKLDKPLKFWRWNILSK